MKDMIKNILLGLILLSIILGVVSVRNQLVRYRNEVIEGKLMFDSHVIDKFIEVIGKERDSIKVIERTIIIKNKELKKEVEKIKQTNDIDSLVIHYTKSHGKLIRTRKIKD